MRWLCPDAPRCPRPRNHDGRRSASGLGWVTSRPVFHLVGVMMPRAAGVSVMCEDEGSGPAFPRYAMERMVATLTAWKFGRAASDSTPASGADGGDLDALRR